MRLDLKYDGGFKYPLKIVDREEYEEVYGCRLVISMDTVGMYIEANGDSKEAEALVIRAVMGIVYLCWGFFPVKESADLGGYDDFTSLGMYTSGYGKSWRYKIRDVDKGVLSKEIIEEFIKMVTKNNFIYHIFALASQDYSKILIDHRFSLMVNVGEAIVDSVGIAETEEEHIRKVLREEGIVKKKDEKKELFLVHKIYYLINKHMNDDNIKTCRDNYIKFMERINGKNDTGKNDIAWFAKEIVKERARHTHIKDRAIYKGTDGYALRGVFKILHIVYRCEILDIIKCSGHKEVEDAFARALDWVEE